MRPLLVLVAFGGCAEPAQPSTGGFVFSPRVGVNTDVTTVLVDGVPYAPQPDDWAGPQAVVFDEEFDDYETAMRSAPVTIEFYAGELRQNVGHVVPGYCFHNCAPSICPALSEMKQEFVRVGQRDFDVGEFDAARCVGIHSTGVFSSDQ